jgi:DNA-binding CsgD family transcriptional regulator
MSDVTLNSVEIVLCDWHGHVNWSSQKNDAWENGDYCWIHLNAESQQDLRDQFAKVVALRETRRIEVVNRDGDRFCCWMWPLDSPDVAACVLISKIASDLTRLTDRESECLELLAQGIQTADIAERLEVSLSTIHTYMKRAREKLGLRNVESLISFAARHCYPTSQPLVLGQAGVLKVKG